MNVHHSRERSLSGSDLEQVVETSSRAPIRIRSRSLHGTDASRLALKRSKSSGGISGGDGVFAHLSNTTKGLRLRSPSFRAGSSLRAPRISAEMSPHISPRRVSMQLAQSYGSVDTESPSSSLPPPLLPSLSTGPTDGPTQAQKAVECLIFGVVNSILTIPCMYAYAAVIFRAPQFQPAIADLSKLVLFSSVVHQCAFSLKSSLPFSIGQVQDAGLIFLSTMATAIAESSSSPEGILATTLVTLSIATALLGAVVYIIGRMRLAKLVSYLPAPVIGGYLGFIGLFCLMAGVGLSIGEDVSKIADFTKAFNVRALRLATPSVVGGALLALISKKIEKWYALPLGIVALPLIFYVYLFVSGLSMQEARESGWLSLPKEGEDSGKPFWEVWKLFDFAAVQWSLLPKQLLTWFSMVFVVSFSSCLDVVAIEMDMGQELDINHELCTVGISNVLSGLTGGFTGSYIFSQTIFTYRTKTNSRLVGAVVIVTELALFMAPFNVMEYVPLYFFAATLIFIAFDLLFEWLYLVFFKVSRMEYLVLVGTFLIITVTNDLMLGILAGIALAVLNFIVAYSSVTHVQKVSKTTSNVVRDFERRKVLASLQGKQKVVRFDLHGFLFFGSSVQIVKKLQLVLEVERQQEEERNKNNGTTWVPTSLRSLLRLEPGPSEESVQQREPLLSSNNGAQLSTAIPPLTSLSRQGSSSSLTDGDDDDLVRFLVLDFARVTGMDASAISTGLMRVKQIGILNDIQIVFTSLRSDFEELLIANHIIVPGDDRCVTFSEINDGLEYVENQLLKGRGLQGRGSPRITSLNLMDTPTLPNIPYAFNPDGSWNKVVKSLQSNPDSVESITWLRRILVDFFGFDRSNFDLSHDNHDEPDLGEYDRLPEFFGLMRLRQGDMVFSVGDKADTLYIVMVGEVSLYVPANESLQMLNKPSGAHWTSKAKGVKTKGKLVQRTRYGSIFGDIHFTLNEDRQFNAVATEEAAVFFLTRARFQEMEKKYPSLAIGLYQVLSKFLSMTVQDLQQYKGMA